MLPREFLLTRIQSVSLSESLSLLTGKYTVFGHVIDGMDVLDRMEKVPTGELGYPHNPLKALPSGHVLT